MFAMYADGMSAVEMARIFNKEGVKTPSQIWAEKGIRKASPQGGTFVWQHTSMLRMLKNRAYVGDLVQGTYECRKLRSDRRVTDSLYLSTMTSQRISVILQNTRIILQAMGL